MFQLLQQNAAPAALPLSSHTFHSATSQPLGMAAINGLQQQQQQQQPQQQQQQQNQSSALVTSSTPNSQQQQQIALSNLSTAQVRTTLG